MTAQGRPRELPEEQTASPLARLDLEVVYTKFNSLNKYCVYI